MLVLRALGLGDFLTAVPALRALRRRYRTHRLLLASPPVLQPLADLAGAVDAILPTAGLGDLRWTGGPVDVAVNLHGSGPESHRDILRTRPKTVITHRHPEFPELGGVHWNSDMHEVARWCALLSAYGVQADPHDLILPPPRERSAAPRCVILHPGAASEARRWPVDRYAEVAEWLTGQGEHVVITGSEAERTRAAAVASAAGLPSESVVAGQTSLVSLSALVSGARLVISGDTGVSHLATAFATPSVTLFGPTPPSEWGPPRLPRHRVLWAGVRGNPHGTHTDAGLLALTVSDVIDAAREQLTQLRWTFGNSQTGKPAPVRRYGGTP